MHCQAQKVKYMGFFRPPPKEKGIKGAIGAESEAVIAAALIQAGYTVLTPNGYMHRYDLVIEDAEGKFWRVQCKTAWLSKDGATLRFNGYSLLMKGQKGRSESKRMNYANDVDYFAVYSPDTRKVYLLPITHVKNTENCLRLIPTGNNQEKNVRWAADYEF
jgi:PD-(D/E)XK nuclease superfamily protein